jgi:serine/threonine-protein kinase
MAICPHCQSRFDDELTECPNDGVALVPDEVFATVDSPLVAGDMVGEYRITGELGRGSFGDVYASEHPLIGKMAAVKVLKRQFTSDPEVISRFISEARAVNKIRNRNIIDIFAFGTLPGGRQYFVMELLEGETLQEFLKTNRVMAVEDALPILGSIARALDAAHEAGIAHRDLKPENVFLCFEKDGSCYPKLLDFGIAKLLADDFTGHQTRTGAAMGTPLYMSPEQCRARDVDHRADIYAFGLHIVCSREVSSLAVNP